MRRRCKISGIIPDTHKHNIGILFIHLREKPYPANWDDVGKTLIGLAHNKEVYKEHMREQFQSALQGESHLCIPFLGIARLQSQFPHSCDCDLYIPRIGKHISLQQNRQTDPGNIWMSHRYMSVGTGRQNIKVSFLEYINGNQTLYWMLTFVCSASSAIGGDTKQYEGNWEVHRLAVTSSLNEISTDQLGNYTKIRDKV